MRRPVRGRAPGWRWLLAHELRLAWRAGGSRLWLLIALVAILWTAMHLAGWVVMRDPSRLMSGPALAVAGTATWFAILVLVASAFGLAIVVLFDRGDLDLLLSSPVAPRTVLAVRGMGVATQSLAIFAMLWLPFAHAAIVHGRWQVAASYPALAALSLGATAIGFSCTLALVRAFGVRRAKTLAQIIGAFVGAGLFLAMQSFNFLPEAMQRRLVAWSRTDAARAWVDADSVLWWPFRALMGDALPFAVVVALGVGAFIAMVMRAERLFLEGTRETPQARVRKGRDPGAFHAGLARVVITKELRLLARDPRLISQTLLQVLYLLPLLFVLGKRTELREITAPTVILIASTLSGNLAWMTMSGEESPDLVGSAPVSRERILWLKLAAALAAPLALCVPFLAYYALVSARAFASFALCLSGALASCAMVQIWTERPGSKRELRTKAQSGKLVNFVEFFSAAGWAAASYLMMRGSWWALVAAGAALLSPAVAWAVGRVRGQTP